MTTIVHLKKFPYDIYIGRYKTGFHYGNPFSWQSNIATLNVNSREEAINNCEKWLDGTDFQDVEPERRKWILEHLEDLRGKRLGCFCNYPNEDCHGRLYIERLEKCK